MAREESSREDLLREATALVERIELALSGQHIVAGFRRDGSLSIFFGEDPVYQFNAAGELRRAYSSGQLIKALDGRLVAMRRVRTEHEVQLVRHELSREEEAEFVRQMNERLRDFARRVEANDVAVVGHVPDGADVLGRVKASLAAQGEVRIAARPNV